MRIASAEAIGFTFDHDREPLSYCLIRVVTDNGIVGWGEACDSFGMTYASVIEAAVTDAYAPLLVGEELDTIDRLMHKLRSWTRRRLGHAWVASQALSGLELALQDALGKARGEPVAVMLGGSLDPVPVYASSVFLEEGDPDWHVGLLEPLLRSGVRGVKMRIGLNWRSDLETLAGLRDRLDPAVALMIDGNENFTVDTALAVADGLADLGIGWFEEPVLQESPPAMDAVAARSPVPIACGEHMYGLAEFEEAIRRNRASVLQPDAATCGGIAEGMRIAAAGRRAGVRVVPHTASGPVALAANLHLAAAAPSIDLLEYPYPLAECWATIAPGCPLVPDKVVDGALRPPDAPGLGVEIDYEAVKSRPYQPPAARTGPSPRYAGNV